MTDVQLAPGQVWAGNDAYGRPRKITWMDAGWVSFDMPAWRALPVANGYTLPVGSFREWIAKSGATLQTAEVRS